VETEKPETTIDWFEATEPEWWLNVVFEVSLEVMQNLLGCVLARDFGTIKPNPRCLLYLIYMQSRLIVWPYDDHGLDVVGPNRDVLTGLHMKHSRWLLDDDREKMDEVFGRTR
jgi:Domain of unknown function (DUF3885)